MPLSSGGTLLPNLSRLAPTAASPRPVGALLAWNVASSDLVLSYFEAVESAIDGEAAAGASAASDSTTAALQKRPRPLATPADRMLENEHRAHLQWLRLCSVPSAPSGTEHVQKVQSRDEPHYSNALEAARVILSTEYVPGRPVLPSSDALVEKLLTDTVKLVNSDAASHTLAPPPFKTLNAGGRAKLEDQYIERLRELRGGRDAFTDKPLPAVGGASAPVAHVVPKAWTRPVGALAEFVGVDGDPTNVVATFKTFNDEMGTSAVYLGALARGNRYADGKYWAPAHFAQKNRAAIARAVACVALTYPFLSADDTAIAGDGGRTRGLPLYSAQIENIVALLAEPPELEDYTLAWVQFATFGWLNPLVVSKRVREAVVKRTEMNALLRKRLAGTDLGSQAAMRALESLGVRFDRR